ncbi:MAG: hypothetical protein FWC64_04080 [Treponema sp.]|nr:hypothetical protein [Treponema sp.]
MKKVIIVFVMAGVLAGSAFAQVSFSGEASMGIRLTNPPGGDESITTQHRDDILTAPRFDLSATVTRENYGARLVTRAQGSPAQGGTFGVRGIYGWVDFNGLASANDSLRVAIGNFADGLWVMQLDADFSEQIIDLVQPGLHLTYATPLQGLTVGAAFRAAGQDMETLAEQMMFGGTFITPFFSTIFAYDLGNNGRTLFGVNVPTFGFAGLHDLSAGFKLFGMNFATWDSTSPGFMGILTMYQRVGYRISWPLSVSLIASQRLFGSPDVNDVELMFGPGVAYRINPDLTASFRAMLDSPDHFSTTNMTLRPAIELMLTGPALFYAEYEFRLPDIGSSNPGNRAVHTIGFGLEIRAF